MAFVSSPVRRPGIPVPTIDELDRKRKIARGDETRSNKKSPRVPFGDRPLFVDDRAGGWTNETPEGRRLADFLNWSTSVDSVGRDEGFGECVRQLLVPALAEAYLKKNYPELHRDDTFENLLVRLEGKIERIETKDWPRSRVARELCDAYHATFGVDSVFEYADDAQARRVTRLLRDSDAYESMDDDKRRLLDEVYPEILSDDDDDDDDDNDDDDDDDDDDDEQNDPEPVSVFVARHLSERGEEIVRVRDVLGARDGEHDVNYLNSFEEFMRDPFTFSA